MLNKVEIIGHLGKDPEIRTTSGGKKMASMTVATSEHWKDANGERKEKVEWHRVTVFNEGLAGVLEKYVKKGSKVYLSGSLATRKYTDKDGVEKYSTEIVLQGFDSKLIMLDRGGETSTDGKSGGESAANEPKPMGGSIPAVELDDSIPF